MRGYLSLEVSSYRYACMASCARAPPIKECRYVKEPPISENLCDRGFCSERKRSRKPPAFRRDWPFYQKDACTLFDVSDFHHLVIEFIIPAGFGISRPLKACQKSNQAQRCFAESSIRFLSYLSLTERAGYKLLVTYEYLLDCTSRYMSKRCPLAYITYEIMLMRPGKERHLV